MKALYTTAEVRRQIRHVHGPGGGRRVVVVAFVGSGADAYLPKPAGVELYCWPQATATSADTLAKLIKRGAEVKFVDRLHVKVFWSERRGAVVCSANLSTNALGAGDLKEAGVFVRSGFDIARLLRGLRTRPATEEALEALRQANRAAAAAGKGPRSASAPTFLEWLAARPKPRWVLSTYDGHVPASKRAKEVALEDRGQRDPEQWLSVSRGSVGPEEFMLAVECDGAKFRSADWLYVHRVVRVDRRERSYVDGYAYQAVQVYPNRACPPPPFAIGRAMRRALRGIDWERYELGRPPTALLRELARIYASA